MLDLECMKLKDAGENHEVLTATRGRATGFGLAETQGACGFEGKKAYRD